MNIIFQNEYELIKAEYPNVDNIFELDLEQISTPRNRNKLNKNLREPATQIYSLLNTTTNKNWEYIVDLYHIAKESPGVIELKQYDFKDNEISEYLDISLEKVKDITCKLNKNINGIVISSVINPERASVDISCVKIATELIKQGDKLKDICALSGMHDNLITDMRKTLRQQGDVKDDFSDAKHAKIRREKVVDLYINTIKSQDEIAQALGITRTTVMTDIQKFEEQNPEYAEAIYRKKCFNARASLGESLIREVLKPYGFKRVLHGELEDKGLGLKGLNLYNEDKKIAIEYDGITGEWSGTSIGHTIEKDLKKDKIIKNMGIDLIRVREPQVEKYENKDVKFFYTNSVSGNIYSKEFLNCVNKLIDYLNDTYDFNIPEVTSVYPYESKINNKYMKDVAKLGDMTMFSYKEMKNSLNAKVINIKDNYRVDVQFEDGSIKKDETYKKFHGKNVAHPKIPNYVLKYMNSINKLDNTPDANNAKVVGINNSKDMKVIIDDEYILTNISAKELKTGELTKSHQKLLTLLKEQDRKSEKKYEYEQNIIFGKKKKEDMLNQYKIESEEEKDL